MDSRITVDQSVNPHQNACTSSQVVQTINPNAVFLGLLDAHGN